MIHTYIIYTHTYTYIWIYEYMIICEYIMCVLKWCLCYHLLLLAFPLLLPCYCVQYCVEYCDSVWYYCVIVMFDYLIMFLLLLLFFRSFVRFCCFFTYALLLITNFTCYSLCSCSPCTALFSHPFIHPSIPMIILWSFIPRLHSM